MLRRAQRDVPANQHIATLPSMNSGIENIIFKFSNQLPLAHQHTSTLAHQPYFPNNHTLNGPLRSVLTMVSNGQLGWSERPTRDLE